MMDFLLRRRLPLLPILSPKKAKYLPTVAFYIHPMAITTIQISEDLLEELKSHKMSDKESYEDIIRELLEDTMELLLPRIKR